MKPLYLIFTQNASGKTNQTLTKRIKFARIMVYFAHKGKQRRIDEFI